VSAQAEAGGVEYAVRAANAVKHDLGASETPSRWPYRHRDGRRQNGATCTHTQGQGAPPTTRFPLWLRQGDFSSGTMV
jgi:hypothetical protein